MEFTPDEILQSLKDDGILCNWIITSQPVLSDSYKKESETGLRVIINMKRGNDILSYEDMLPHVEEIVDRFESDGYYLYYIRFSDILGPLLPINQGRYIPKNDDIKKYNNLEGPLKDDTSKFNIFSLQFEKNKIEEPKTRFQKMKSFLGFNESLILEDVKFNKQPKKKGAKTEVYNVVNGGTTIGQVKWSSRMRGYGFLPTKDCEKEVKEFASELMKKWRAERKKNKPKKK